MNHDEIKKKRMLGFDVDYPLIEDIKSAFKEKALCNLFEPAKSGESVSTTIPLIQFEYILKHPDIDLEKRYVRELLDLLRLEEIRLVFKILKDNDCLEKGIFGDIFFSLKPHIGIYHPDITENFFVSKKMNFSYELEHTEEGCVDIDNNDLRNEKHSIILKISYERLSNVN